MAMGVSYLCSKKKGKEMGKRKSMKGTGLKSLLVVDILGMELPKRLTLVR